jgi:PadR family transcriptional regulator PadR
MSISDRPGYQMSEIRLTQPTLKVLRFLLENPRDGQSGAEISKATSVGSGTLYPMLARLEALRWLSAEWEQIDPREAGRPRKRYYRLTGLGHQNAQSALSELQVVPGALAWTF